MTNYDDMSDFQINKAVAEALYPAYHWMAIPDYIDKGHTNSVIAYDDQGNRHDEGYIFDYCNNPSDMHPIILEHKISTGWAFTANDVCIWEAVITNQGRPGAFMRVHQHDENPLRAAAIVYLKMEDAK